MRERTRCWKHDIWHADESKCPRCLAEEADERQQEYFARAEEAREDAKEREQEQEEERERFAAAKRAEAMRRIKSTSSTDPCR